MLHAWGLLVRTIPITSGSATLFSLGKWLTDLCNQGTCYSMLRTTFGYFRFCPEIWSYSCNNITTTLIQISRLFYFGFFSKTDHQMIIKLTPIVSRSKSKWYKAQKVQKCALNSQLQAHQNLTHDDEVENWSLSSFLLAVTQIITEANKNSAHFLKIKICTLFRLPKLKFQS